MAGPGVPWSEGVDRLRGRGEVFVRHDVGRGGDKRLGGTGVGLEPVHAATGLDPEHTGALLDHPFGRFRRREEKGGRGRGGIGDEEVDAASAPPKQRSSRSESEIAHRFHGKDGADALAETDQAMVPLEGSVAREPDAVLPLRAGGNLLRGEITDGFPGGGASGSPAVEASATEEPTAFPHDRPAACRQGAR